jgi:hypothetical protein
MLKINPALSKEAKLKILETEYCHLVRNPPSSFNATVTWHQSLQKCVAQMRSLRGIKRDAGMGWLQQILNRPPTQ